MSGTTRLREIGNTYGGLTGKTKTDFGNGNASFIQFLDVVNSTQMRQHYLGSVRVANGERQNAVRRGDLLFNGSSETPDEVALSSMINFDPGPNTYLNSFCFGFRLRPNVDVDPMYLAYFFRSPFGRSLISPLAQGATRYNIAKSQFLNLKISLPPLFQQKKIVERICSIDNYIISLEETIVKKQAIKQGTMQQLLPRRELQSVYPYFHLSDLIGSLEAGVSVRSSENASRDIAVLKTSAVDKGRFDPSEAKQVSFADMGRVRCSPVARGLVISRMNTPTLVGEVGYVERDYPRLYLPDRLWLARPASEYSRTVNMRWLGYYLSSEHGSRTVRELATGTSGSMKNIPKDRMLDLEIPTPPLPEQDHVASTVRDVDLAIDSLHRRLVKAQAVKQGMMQQLLTRRTRLPAEEDGAA